MPYTLGEAAKATGKVKSTILDSIKSGRISASKNQLGRYEIDPAELHRLYPPLPVAPVQNDREQPAKTDDNGPNVNELQARLNALEQLYKSVLDQNTDLKQQRDKWQQEADDWKAQAGRLLPAPETKPQPRRGLLARLFRGAAA